MSELENIEHCTLEAVGITATPNDGHEAEGREMVEDLEKYFANFAKPEEGESGFGKGHKCIKCGAVLTGFFGTFEWGICHGEGRCNKCGWPARAHHFIKDRHGKDLAALRNVVLQYHPDQVKMKEAAKP